MIRYAITDRTLFAGDEAMRRAALVQQAVELSRAGVDFVQLREKDLAPRTLVALARELMRALRANAERSGTPPKLLINSRLDVAIAAEADGVHLTSRPGELRPAQVRWLYARAGLKQPIISVSCHSLDDVGRITRGMAASAPDLILFGPVFEKVVRTASASATVLNPGDRLPTPVPLGTRVVEGSGLDLLRLCCAAAAPIPVLALGGVTTGNTPACLAAGAAGVAGIRLFQPQPRPGTD